MKVPVTSEEIEQFVRDFDRVYEGKLSNVYNFSRVVQLAWLNKVLEVQGRKFHKIGVISGSENEPELRLVSFDSCDFLSFEQDAKYDLDTQWDEEARFDLTLCNQVLEHLFNPQQAMANLVACTVKNGYIFVSVPTVNRIHGEPFFYSSGYHPRFLERLGKTAGVKLVAAGQWGSRKYLLHAVNGSWLPHNKLRRGIRSKSDLYFPFLALSDGRYEDRSGTVITDCWVLFQR